MKDQTELCVPACLGMGCCSGNDRPHPCLYHLDRIELQGEGVWHRISLWYQKYTQDKVTEYALSYVLRALLCALLLIEIDRPNSFCNVSLETLKQL